MHRPDRTFNCNNEQGVGLGQQPRTRPRRGSTMALLRGTTTTASCNQIRRPWLEGHQTQSTSEINTVRHISTQNRTFDQSRAANLIQARVWTRRTDGGAGGIGGDICGRGASRGTGCAAMPRITSAAPIKPIGKSDWYPTRESIQEKPLVKQHLRYAFDGLILFNLCYFSLPISPFFLFLAGNWTERFYPAYTSSLPTPCLAYIREFYFF